MKGERLLIISCSRRKRPEVEPLPALERYNGPAYWVLRKHRREGGVVPTTWVLSAAYGLIPAELPIHRYDQQMTPARALALQPQISATLDVLADEGFAEALVCAGQAYRAELGGVDEQLGCPVTFTAGPIGRQLAMLRDWLYGAPPEMNAPQLSSLVSFRGRRIDCTVEEVFCLARERAVTDPVEAGRYASWYILVGEHRVAPKWLLSKLTGVPVSTFRTADALKIFAKLGVEVHRT